MNELKTCPFCGGTKPYIDENIKCIACFDCEAIGPTAETVEEAIALWNAAPRPEPVTTGSESTPLNDLCTAAVNKWGAAAQVQKAVEELSELTLALTRWLNRKDPSDEIIDNIREEREDVEIMLLQLDAMFGRSAAWRREKYEHLRAIVEMQGD